MGEKQRTGYALLPENKWKASRAAVDLLLRALGYPGIPEKEPPPQTRASWERSPIGERERKKRDE